ncbi:MAG: TlpA family protein disulfide reductase [Gammaproteobacteria bacterium]|nr:TlpA family protein disulfide reductase [Gammaproteobacteria bacterium]
MYNSLIIKGLLVAWALAVSPIAVSDLPTGQDFDLAKYQGKVVVLDFWASWCVPCRRSFPWLNAMNAKYGHDGLVVIGINVDQEPASAAEFLQKYPASFQISYDTNGVLAKEFGVQAMPSSFVIGRDGQINAHHLGFKVKRQDEYEAVIVAALRQEKVE